MRRQLILITITLLAAATCAHADTIHVDWTGAGDYETIAEGIDAADTGDTVLVAPGGYFGEGNRDLHFDGKDITVMSTGGPRSTTVNADNLGRCFAFTLGEGPDAVLSGFTITNGTAAQGGGIFCYAASPTIIDCNIMACTATSTNAGGGGFWCQEVESSPTLVDVTITACTAYYGGGFGSIRYATPTLTRVTLRANTSWERGGGAYFERATGEVAITDCVFLGNTSTSGHGGGLNLFDTSASITGATFARNRGSWGGCIELSQTSSPTIENSILSFSPAGKAIYRFSENEVPTTTRCIVYGNDDGDDLVGTYSDILNEDPRFCDMLGGDLTLCTNSPALVPNNPWSVLMGPYGSACGDCDSPVQDATWGRIKGLYR